VSEERAKTANRKTNLLYMVSNLLGIEFVEYGLSNSTDARTEWLFEGSFS
jgi:hypothetical protein